jgi:hypothetical protein
VPEESWLTYLRIDAPAEELTGDLAIDVDGHDPSPVAAGLTGGELASGPLVAGDGGTDEPWAWALGVLAIAAMTGGVVLLLGRERRVGVGDDR